MSWWRNKSLGLVKKEMPKRLVCVVFCWNSRGYTSMLSNGDVWAVSRYKKPKEVKGSSGEDCLESSGATLNTTGNLVANGAQIRSR